MRVDKWLWAARFFKTRSLAQQAIAAGRVKVNDERIKPAFDLKVGDSLSARVGDYEWIVRVKALSERRGPSVQAKLLYDETAASRQERERRMDMRRWSAEPAAALKGRPTKKDRRELEEWTQQPEES